MIAPKLDDGVLRYYVESSVEARYQRMREAIQARLGVDVESWTVLATKLRGYFRQLHSMATELLELRIRRDELLALVASISKSSVTPAEAQELNVQIAVLIAEVGTLRSRVRELEGGQ